MSALDQESKPETMGRRLAATRVLRGLKQDELADKVGVSQGHLSTLEQDKGSPSIELVVRLASELRVSLDYLVKGEAA